MRIKEMMVSLLEGLKQPENRGVGHTRNAIQFARSIGAMYVMPLIGSFHIVDKEFGNSKNLISLTQIEHGTLRHRKGPIVLDNYTISFLIEESLRGFRALEDMAHASDRVAEAARIEANELRSELNEYKKQVDKMKKVIDKLNKKTGKK